MTVLLTGATGFVGRTVLGRLLAAECRVRVLVRDPGRLEVPAGCEALLEIQTGSLTRPESLEGVARGVESVIHLAGELAARRNSGFYAVNQQGTALLAAQVSRDAPGARWLQVSSLAAEGPSDGSRDPSQPRPVSHYGRSKLGGEAAVREAGLEDWIVFRPPAVYGPGDRAFLPFFERVARSARVPVPVVEGQRFSFVHVDDLARSLVAGLEAPPGEPGAVLHPAHPGQHTIPEFLAFLGEAVGGTPRPMRLPHWLGWVSAALVAPVRALTGAPRFLSLDKMREITASSWCCSPARAEERLDWRAEYDLRAGTSQTAAAYRAAGWLDPVEGAA